MGKRQKRSYRFEILRRREIFGSIEGNEI